MPEDKADDPVSSVKLTTTSECTDTPSAEANSVTKDDVHETWSGWAELENDPAIFTTLLREWGALNIAVHEVVPLESLFDYPPQNIFGLIFLSRWAAQETENEITEPPGGVWFANQTSNYSCATVALMNIINNRPDLELGAQLSKFRSTTLDMTPKDRGLALDQFDLVKDVHNSFSTQFDRMSVDLRLKQEIAETKKKAKKSRKRKREESEESEEAGFHFVAYVPVGGTVWRMDGLERLPRKVGLLNEGDSWIAMVLSELQVIWEGPDTPNLEYSLLSLTSAAPAEDGGSTIDEEMSKMERAREDWGPFISYMVQLHAEKGDLKDLMD